jgi:U3 small nucleolar ribonucleoprotein protein IMP3
MVRKLKHHESRLLRKVDLVTYRTAGAQTARREQAIRRRYRLTQPQDYSRYNELCGRVRQAAHLLSRLEPSSPFRMEQERALLDKLHEVGVVKRPRRSGAGLSAVEKEVTVSSFARRRIGVVMVRTGMVEHVAAAVRFVEQGHVRVGTHVVTDPAFLVTRPMEDFVTWVDGSKIKRTVLRYRDKLDDFDLL